MTVSGGPRTAAGRAGAASLRDGVTPLCDVVAAHAGISAPQQLVADRRALYRFAVALTGVAGDRRVPDDVLDDPALRFAVGEVLAGRRAADDLPVPGPDRPPVGPGPAIAGDAARLADIRPALDAVAQSAARRPS